MSSATDGFELRPVDPARDLDLLHRWMNDPAVAAFWQLAVDRDGIARYLCEQLGSAHSTPYLGVLAGRAMSYWELYRADLDPLAAHYPARPYDAGVHLLLGPPEYRGRGVGAMLLRAVGDALFAADPRTDRVVAEPDVRNTASVRAFGRAGFRQVAELDLPDKRAALMVRDRAAVTQPAAARVAAGQPTEERRVARVAPGVPG